jgi:hypothetical protein
MPCNRFFVKTAVVDIILKTDLPFKTKFAAFNQNSVPETGTEEK